MTNKKVSEETRRLGRKIDRIGKMASEHIALLGWEVGVLRATLQVAAELLAGSGWKPVKRGDRTKRERVLRTARIHKPAPAPEEGTDGR